MDAEKIKTLCASLYSTLSPHREQRENAEVQLARFETVPGFALALFQLINAPDVGVEIRHAASILFKNLTKSRWLPPQDPAVPLVFGDEVKQIIKNNLLLTISNTTKLTRVQLGLCLTEIMTHDFPATWPSLVPQCLQLIASQNPASIEGALFSIRMITKRYEWCTSQNERREELNTVVEQTFPTLLELFKYLLTMDTIESLNMQILIVKTFWSATQYGMPPHLVPQERFAAWMALLLQVLARVVPPNKANGSSDEDREKWEPWIIKKWVATLFDRLIQRHAVERNNDNPHNKEFSKIFMENFVLKLLEAVLNVLTGPMANYLPRKFRTALLSYLNNSVYHSKTWLMVKPHVDKIFQSVLFPTLIWGPSDLQLFKDDPEEYIRQQFDYVAEFSDPRNAVTQFILDTVKLRGDEFMVIYMNYLVHNVLTKYQSSPPAQRNYAEKDAALVVIGNLAPLLKTSETFKGALEDMLVIHVAPELTSSVGFMRARAVWVFGQFYNVQFKNPDNFVNAVQIIVHSIGDQELPVRVYSALSLHFLVKSKLVKPKIEAILPQLLEAYLKLMGEIDNDDLVGALQTLIKKYRKSVTHLAPVIAAKLFDQYGKLISRGNELFEDEDQTGMLTAIQLLKAIQTLLDSVQSNQEIIQALQPILKNLLLTINPGLVDLFTDYIQILAMYTFYVDKIAPDMWEVFIKFADAFMDWGTDFSGELLIPFDNFISKDTETFLSNPIFLEKICKMYQLVLQNPNAPETDSGALCTLMEVVLVYCTGRVDPIVPQVLRLAVERLNTAELPPFRVLLIEVFANCLYYNPALTFSICESSINNWVPNLFGLWFQMLNEHFTRLHDVKLTIIALTSILKVPFAMWPDTLKTELKNILNTIMELIFKFTTMKVEKEAENENGKENDGEDESDEEDDKDESDDLLGNEIGLLKDSDEGVSDLFGALTGDKKIYGDQEDIFPEIMNGDLADKLLDAYGQDEEDDFDLEDEDDFEVKTDQIDEVIFFCEAFSGFSQTSPQVYEALLKVLSDTDKQKLQQLAQEANKRMLEKAAQNTNKQ